MTECFRIISKARERARMPPSRATQSSLLIRVAKVQRTKGNQDKLLSPGGEFEVAAASKETSK